MCAIVDANVTPEVFGGSHPTNEAGQRFFSWLNTGKGKLVLGGKLRNELGAIRNFREWAAQAIQAGIVQSVDDAAVNKEARELESGNALHSDDAHIIALARVSGARLLYSNDQRLQDDFTDHRLINRPRGKVFSTRQTSAFTAAQRSLLANKNLCRIGRRASLST